MAGPRVSTDVQIVGLAIVAFASWISFLAPNLELHREPSLLLLKVSSFSFQAATLAFCTIDLSYGRGAGWE